MNPILSIEDLQFNLPQFQLHIQNMSLDQGEYFVIVGKTGSGKTVLLECLAGIKEVVNGHIIMDTVDITNQSPENRQIGFAYQDSLLFPFMTVQENILVSAKARNLHKEMEILQRMHDLVDRMGIAHLVSRYPRHLSGGERQRVSLARAILLRPRLLLLDEPLSALDTTMRKEMSDLLKELHQKEGMTMIHVTHDISEALQLGTQMAVLQEGQFIEVNEPYTLFMTPKKLDTASFLGVENLKPIEVENEGDQLRIKHEDGSFLMAYRKRVTLPVSIGIRSIMLRIQPPNTAYHHFTVQINQISFNGQLVLVQCVGRTKWLISIPINEWLEENHAIGDQVKLYVALDNILLFEK